VAELLQGGTILFISMGKLWASGQIGWSSVPYTIITLVTGTVILFAIALATATTGFWITRIRELQVVTEDSARFAAQYPMSLYPKWLQLMLLTLIPVGFANYVPALFILRGQFGVWVIGATALVAAVSLALSLVFWRYGLSKYQSAGS
jgi:ABC-2 type transport system permease protein